MKFNPKKDLIYGIILLPLSFFLIAFSVLFPIYFDADVVSIIVITVLCLPLGVYFLWCWFGTSYWILEDKLVIKQGPFRRSINIDQIEIVQKNTNPLVASTALSLESYVLQYKPYKTFIISPMNIEEFVNELRNTSGNHTIKFEKD
ncbi:PH domain-containing protein [Halalkalibacter sp. AB-rgal2]|uniref:PH domain-containing protein n=1 Tax=Halalkalibacter sp. AB-rgal2 TaxID=3242695 RepID=UPI00359EB4D6